MEILGALVGAGGDPNLANPVNYLLGYPVFAAISSSNMDNLPALLFLIEHGANLRARSESRDTPLLFAISMAQFDLAVAILHAEPMTRCDVIVTGDYRLTVDGLIASRTISEESGQIPFRDTLVQLIAEVECPQAG